MIPLEVFEQSKLESMLRAVPSALVREEKTATYVRKHYLYPKDPQAPFSISCYADYFKGAPIPSLKVCEVSIKSIELTGDEYYIELKGTDDLRKSLTSNEVTKKIYSHERVYGQSHEGPYRQLFRYSILCQEAFCAFSFSPKKAI